MLTRLVDSLVDPLLFTPGKSSYDLNYSARGRELIAIRGEMATHGGAIVYVPCILSRSPSGASNTLVVHFHGTGGDIAKSGAWFDTQAKGSNVHVLAVEFPGYGVFPGYNASSKRPMPPSDHAILDTARVVLRHVRDVWKWPMQNVMISGRSMGSGPATRLAKEFNPGAVVVLSGYASIIDVAGDKVPALKWLVNERFMGNEGSLRDFRGHGYIAHGARDPLIRLYHAHRLHDALSNAASRHLVIDPEGQHKDIDIVPAIVGFVDHFKQQLASSSTFPDTSVPLTDADDIKNARPWLEASRVLESSHRHLQRTRKIMIGLIAVATLALLLRRWVT